MFDLCQEFLAQWEDEVLEFFEQKIRKPELGENDLCSVYTDVFF